MAQNEEQLLQQGQVQNTAQDTTQAATQAQQKVQPTKQQTVQQPASYQDISNVKSSTITQGAPSTTQPQNDYANPYDAQLKDLYNQIVNQKPFEYDANDDAMYQAYKDRYMELGQQAMKDTMGQAAALTGGYGSSYGQAVGQQQYDQYMLGLNDKASELYQMAYQRYQDDANRQLQNYSLMGDMADRDYNLWSGAYDRGMSAYAYTAEEAAARAQFGDFSGYADLYGEDQAHDMALAWAAANPDAAWAAGTITADEYYILTGQQARGAPGGGGGGSGQKSMADILRGQQAAVIAGAAREAASNSPGFYTSIASSVAAEKYK